MQYMTPDTWHMTPETWHLTHETCHMTPDTWHMTTNMWQLIFLVLLSSHVEIFNVCPKHCFLLSMFSLFFLGIVASFRKYVWWSDFSRVNWKLCGGLLWWLFPIVGRWSAADTDNKLYSNDNVAYHYSPRHTVLTKIIILYIFFLTYIRICVFFICICAIN